jgi:hypothetical protein
VPDTPSQPRFQSGTLPNLAQLKFFHITQQKDASFAHAEIVDDLPYLLYCSLASTCASADRSELGKNSTAICLIKTLGKKGIQKLISRFLLVAPKNKHFVALSPREPAQSAHILLCDPPA